MMIGSANDAMTASESSRLPMLAPLNTANELLVTVTHMMPMMAIEVAQVGIHSVSQASVANAKMAMMRC